MKVFKNVLLGMALIVSTGIYAQTNVGIKAGVNFADMNRMINRDTDDDTKMKLGFNLGVVGNHYFSDILGVEGGLIIENKGFEYRFDDNGRIGDNADYGKRVTNIMYLDIPVNLKAKMDLGDIRIFGQFGPYIGFALCGKEKTTGDFKEDMETIGFDTEKTFEFGGSARDDDFKRTDFGLMFGAGVGFKELELGIGYDIGLTNLLPGGDTDNYVKNRVFKISIAYMLGI